MKQNAKMIIMAMVATLIIATGCFVTFQNTRKEKTAVLEFVKYDAKDNSKEVYYTLTIKEKDVVNLDVELDVITDNNITILEINNKNIKISREITKYKVISEEEKKAEPYKENVTETIKYGDTISIDADAHDPFGPAYASPRYHSYIKVVKGNL